MKYLIIFLSVILSTTSVFAGNKDKNDIVTEEYLVSGNCGDCKEHIEKAAYIKGVKRARWDKSTKKLTVTYRKSKTSGEEILKSIADSGYDSQMYTATGSAYNKLPKCCRYRTGKCGE